MPAGRIALVPTPIGNLGDITTRAIETLRQADLIACEDTRHTARLLSHLEISGTPLVSLHEHNEAARSRELIDAARSGQLVAVVSDAGMPGVSDPGYRLVQACLDADLALDVLPGPSAVLTALIGSGLPTHQFHFHGFLSVKKGKRLKALDHAVATEGTTIFFESPHRLTSTLEIAAEHHPGARLCIARELSKKFETYHRGHAPELLDHFRAHPPKGEIVLLIAAPATK